MMEEPSSSSKVTVEYFDPFGVYQLLSPGFLPRLPLRNLHWESHSGPLRSISSLHIDLVPSAQELRPTTSNEISSGSTNNLSRVKSEDSTTSGEDGFKTQALGSVVGDRPGSISGPSRSVIKERRHQIPGLRQTPYLKVFFLRCDDSETYKSQARQQVRAWLKEHTPPAQSTSKSTAQENHDAFEWMIVHVIVPNTAAATQPRTNGKGAEGSSGSTSEKTATARWRGGNSSTILDKLRADFNGSSKSSLDRVAQIRIGINDVPYDMLPRVVPAIPGSYTETPAENDAAWLDLIAKFKQLILISFDMRVGQYEEDIREKDAQRTLPGWNFCTFFVLKEGLCRGFESVGLVEDALVGYDELSVGLDAIIRDQSAGSSGAALSFLPFTEDLKQQAFRARRAVLRDMGVSEASDTEDTIDLQSSAEDVNYEDYEIPLNASKKRYRELILSNDISIFDFRCYVFARQLSLLLRLANVSSSRQELLAKLKEQRDSSLQGVAARLPAAQPSDDVENLAVLGEICKRSMEFVVSIGKIMRDDLKASFNSTCLPEMATEDNELKLLSDGVIPEVVDNIISSFTFAVAQQILAQTATKALPIPPSTLAPPSSSLALDGQEPKAAIPEPKTMMHPARSSSLALRSSSREPPSPGIFPGGRRSSVPEQGSASSPFLKNGLEELAGHRAELYLLSRNIMEAIGRKRGWSVGWPEIAHLQDVGLQKMEDVDLEGGSSLKPSESVSRASPSSSGVSSKLLQAAIENQDDFYRLYETLTDKALRHYTVANHLQSVQSSMSDLAILKYYLKDFAAASSYFYRTTRLYGDGGWAEVELSMLVMYANCLRDLQRKEEFVRVVLKLLSKAALAEKERLKRKSMLNLGGSNGTGDLGALSGSYLLELLEITKSLQHEVRVPLGDFFGYVEVDGGIRYHPEMDSMGLQLQLQYLLPDGLAINKAKIRLVPISNESGDATRELWLETDKAYTFRKGIVKLSLQSNVIIPGSYLVNYISLHADNTTFWYDHGAKGPTNKKTDHFFMCPELLVYQRSEAFDLKLLASRYMHLDRNRSLEIVLSSGWNDVNKGELHVRAATAGLRLQTSEAKVVSGSLEISKKSEAGIVRFGALKSNSNVKISMPFNLEHEVNEISLKLEISYTTDKGTFFYATIPSVSIMLPLGVNVQDVFKHKALFSKFSISSASTSPLRLLSSRLEGSNAFKAEGGAPLLKPLMIYPRQPASMLYKITRTGLISKPEPGLKKISKSSLSLVLNYMCLEEEIENAVSQSLRHALKKHPLHSQMRLILLTVTDMLLKQMSPYDLERTAVLGEVPTTTFLSTVRWRNHFSGLGSAQDQDQDMAIVIEEFLHTWQKSLPIIPLIQLHLTEEVISNSRSIIIPVDVPSVSVVHTADLKILDTSPVPASTAVVALNQPVSASLIIKWTRTWDHEFELEKNADPNEADLEFFYEVSGPSELWLIGGKRKGHFKIPKKTRSIDHKEKLSFPVVLIPLREGFLPFPNVEIRAAPAPKVIVPGATDENNKAPIITCETDFKNAGETIRVISDARKTTVSLDASGPQGGAWLLESEKRKAVGNGAAVST